MRAVVGAALVIVGCRSPTQYRVVVRNDAPCPATVTLRINGEERASAATCGGGSDDIVIVPRNDATAFTVDLATANDIEQSWKLLFRDHESQTFTTTLSPSCAGVACGADRTCFAGACVPSLIERDCSGGCAPASVAEPDAGPPPPVTVRLINAGTGGFSGHIDACVETSRGMSAPLLESLGHERLRDFEVSGDLALADDTGEVITIAIANGEPARKCDGAPRATIRRPPPGGRIFALKKGGFEVVLANDVLPPAGAGVTMRVFHASDRFREPVEFSVRLETAGDVWPKEFSNIPFANVSSALSFGEKVLLVSARTMSGAGIAATDVFPVPPENGRTYTTFVFGEEGHTVTAIRVCDDRTASATLRALCLK